MGRGLLEEFFLTDCHAVSNPREAALDSEFLSICTHYASEQATRFNTQVKVYDVSSYIQRLSLFLRGKLFINVEGLAEERKQRQPRSADENGEDEAAGAGGEGEMTGEENGDGEEDQTLGWAELGALVAGFAQATPSLDCL